MTPITIMAEIGNHAGNEPWPSLEWASWIFDRASFVLIGSLVIGVIATVAIVWMGIVKEHHWDLAREKAAAEVEDTKLEAAKANKEAANARLATERLRLRFVWRMIDPGPQDRMVERLKKFAPQQFAILTFNTLDPEITNFAATIRTALEKAGWKYLDLQTPQRMAVGLWLAWANSSAPVVGPIAQEVGTALAEAGQAPQGHEVGDKYEGYGNVLFVLVGRKQPSAIEIPSLEEGEK